MDGVPESAAELVGVIQATGGGSRERVLADAIRRATAGRDNFSILVAGCLVEFRTGHYWTRLNYAKFGAFVRAELSFGVRAAQLMIRVYRVRVTERHIPPARLRALGWSKLAVVIRAIPPRTSRVCWRTWRR